MSVKLTTSLSQRLVLTPQLRQRIEMLQMTSLELSDLIQQQLLENPILEEVQKQDEQRGIPAPRMPSSSRPRQPLMPRSPGLILTSSCDLILALTPSVHV